MPHLLVKNTVRDYAVWKREFDAQAEAVRAAGLTLMHLWREMDEPSTVWFLFDAADRARADAYMADPESAKVGEWAGVTGGEVFWLEHADG